MAITINTRIQNKNDLLSNWVEADPILLKGELATVVLSSNVVKLKVGDGKTKFTDLPYAYDSQFNDIRSLVDTIGNDYLTSEDKADILNQCIENNELSLFLSGNSLVLDIAGAPHEIVLSNEYALKTPTEAMFASTAAMIAATNASLAETESRVSANAPKIYVSEDGGTTLEQVSELKLINIGAEEYFKLVKDGEVLSNAIYEISSDFSNAFGQQIKNVAEPTDDTDVTTKGYVDSKIETILDDCTTSAEVSAIVDGFGFTDTYVDGVKTDLSTMHISEVDYFELVKNDNVVSNMVYVVSSDEDNHFGQRITNLGEPELSSDAATKNYVDTEISKIDVSEQLEEYQKKGNYVSSYAVVEGLSCVKIIDWDEDVDEEEIESTYEETLIRSITDRVQLYIDEQLSGLFETEF